METLKKCVFFKEGKKKNKAPYVVAFIVDRGFPSTPKQENEYRQGLMLCGLQQMWEH